MAATVLVTVAAAALALSPDRDADRRVAAPPPSPAVTSAFNGTDAAWLQVMIALDEGAVRLLDLTARRTSDPGVRSLVQEIGPTHRAELEELKRLGELAELPAVNVHADHEMPGMVTTGRLAGIGAQTGDSFERTVRETLREYLTQCVNLSMSEQKFGAELETRALAGRIHERRSTHLAKL